MRTKRKFILTLITIVFMAGNCCVLAMEPVDSSKLPVYITTNDGRIQLPQWQVAAMKNVIPLLEEQKGSNSSINPVNLVPLNVTTEEVNLVSTALSKARLCKFEDFFFTLAYKDKLMSGDKPKINYTLGEGKLKKLVTAAKEVGAIDINKLCLSLFVTNDIQKNFLVPELLKSAISYLNSKRIISMPGNPKTVTSMAIQHSTDKRTGGKYSFLFSGCHGSENNLGYFWLNAQDPKPERFSRTSYSNIYSVVANKNSDLILYTGSAAPHYNLGITTIRSAEDDRIPYDPLLFPPDTIINALAFDPKNDNKIICGFEDFWDSSTLWQIDRNDEKNIKYLPIKGHSGSVKSIAYSPDGNYILSGGSREVFLWKKEIDSQTGEAVFKGTFKILDDNAEAKAVAWSPDSQIIVFGTGGIRNNLFLCTLENFTTNIAPINLEGHSAPVSAITFSSDGETFFSSSDNEIIMWNTKELTPTPITVKNMPHGARCMAFNPYGDKPQIVFGCKGAEDNLFVIDLLSTEEKKNLHNLADIKQARLITELCLASSLNKDEKIVLGKLQPECQAFLSLPANVKSLLIPLLNITLPISMPANRNVMLDSANYVYDLEKENIHTLSSNLDRLPTNLTDIIEELEERHSIILGNLHAKRQLLNAQMTQKTIKISTYNNAIRQINLKSAIAEILYNYLIICLKLKYEPDDSIGEINGFLEYFTSAVTKLQENAHADEDIFDKYDKKILNYIMASSGCINGFSNSKFMTDEQKEAFESNKENIMDILKKEFVEQKHSMLSSLAYGEIPTDITTLTQTLRQLKTNAFSILSAALSSTPIDRREKLKLQLKQAITQTLYNYYDICLTLNEVNNIPENLNHFVKSFQAIRNILELNLTTEPIFDDKDKKTISYIVTTPIFIRCLLDRPVPTLPTNKQIALLHGEEKKIFESTYTEIINIFGIETKTSPAQANVQQEEPAKEYLPENLNEPTPSNPVSTYPSYKPPRQNIEKPTENPMSDSSTEKAPSKPAQGTIFTAMFKSIVQGGTIFVSWIVSGATSLWNWLVGTR